MQPVSIETQTRRGVLLGGAALAACAAPQHAPPSAPDPGADAELRAFVEQLATATPEERASALRGFNRNVSDEGRILLAAIAGNAENEAAMARAGYRTEGPYAVTTRQGAYRRVTTPLAQPNTDLAALVHDIDADTTTLSADADRGFIAPDFVLDRTFAAIGAVQAQAASSREVQAALGRQLDVLRALRSRTQSGAGVWRAGHADYYAKALHYSFGAPIDPVDAHRRALAVTRDLQAQTDVLLRGEGLTQGSVGERLRELLRDERYLYPDSDAGRTQAVLDMNIQLTNMRTTMRNAFASGLEATPAEVRRMSAEDEARGVAGGRSGQSYVVDLSHIRARPKWTLQSVVNHELLPGHLLQGPAGEAAHPSRLQTRYASGYSEGWAIYAERLADELGAFAAPRDRIGYLQWMLFRYGRVVADTGIHAMRWDRARAIAEMREMQGQSIAFITIEEDVERFCVQPGLYAAQGLAALDIHELRERIKRAAARRFALPRFHDAMLKRGPMAPPGLAQAARAELA